MMKCPHCNRFDEGIVGRGYCRHCGHDLPSVTPSEGKGQPEVGTPLTQAHLVSSASKKPYTAFQVGTNVTYCPSCRTISSAPGSMEEKCSRCGQRISSLGPLAEALIPNRTAAVVGFTVAIAVLVGGIALLLVTPIALVFFILGLVLLAVTYGNLRQSILVCEYGLASTSFWNPIGFRWSEICNVLEEYEQGGSVTDYTVTLERGEFKFQTNFPRDAKRLADLIFSRMGAKQANWIKKVTKQGVLVDTVTFTFGKEQPFDSGQSYNRLIEDLGHEREHIRWDAARQLGLMGQKAKEAVPVLMRLLNDKDGGVRRAAYEALQAINAAVGREKGVES